MRFRVPGDKSITQRALILSALATGESRLRGLLTGADPRSTGAVLRELGLGLPRLPHDGSEVRVSGRGLRGLRASGRPLDCGNSGTAARLLLGVLAAQEEMGDVVVTGDASLRSRPMARVTDPLSAMGARFEALGDPGRLPLRVRGGGLGPLEYETPVASAQVKSSLLLAGVCSGAFVLLTEPGRSRDHTERMLTLMGASLVEHDAPGGGWRVELRDPPEALAPLDFRVPGDLSSAAFFLVLGLLGGVAGELVIEDVGLNPTRTGILPVLRAMGAELEVREESGGDGEPRGDLALAGPQELVAVEVGEAEIPGLIDEIPVLAAAAARARGTTRITGAAELRVKETDRLRALADGLRAVGVDAEELDDGLEIEGSDAPLRGRVHTFGDHRIAMAFGVLGALGGNEIEVDDPGAVEVSFPGFWQRLREAGT